MHNIIICDISHKIKSLDSEASTGYTEENYWTSVSKYPSWSYHIWDFLNVKSCFLKSYPGRGGKTAREKKTQKTFVD